MAYDFSKLKTGISHAEAWLTNELAGLRTGRASPAFLDAITVEVYGSMMKLPQVASVTVEGPRSLFVAPWDKSQLKPIEKAITVADLGVGVGSDDTGVRVSFPELTTERRTQLIKLVKAKLEEARISMKGERTKAMEEIERDMKNDELSEDEGRRAKEDAQKLIDAGNKQLEAIAEKKERELAS
ncbi:ribosome recycling factor [Patescibacteria group bacterium]|nr:ribosome recycling factor [Patescibacteria group bacterium]